MMLRALIFAAVFCTDALAQFGLSLTEDCEASGPLAEQGEEIFNYCTEVLGMQIFWNYNPNDTPPNVEVLVQSPIDGWNSFGFTSGGSEGSMFPSGVIMACFDFDPEEGDDEFEAADWSIDGRTLPTQVPNQQGLLNYTEVRNGTCNFRFTRPLAPENAPIRQHLGDTLTRVIAAYGGEELAQHDHNTRVAFNVNFATGENSDASSLHIASATFIIATIGAVSSLML